jgi:hypothetical protein
MPGPGNASLLSNKLSGLILSFVVELQHPRGHGSRTHRGCNRMPELSSAEGNLNLALPIASQS